MAVIRSGASSTDLTVDTASLAARVTLYDTLGVASGGRVTYQAGARLTAAGVGLSQAIVATTALNAMTVHHASASTKTARIQKWWLTVFSISAASNIAVDLISISTAPATGNPAITPVPLNRASAAADSTVFALPSTQGTATNANTGIGMTLMAVSAAATTNTTVLGLGTPIILYQFNPLAPSEQLVIRAGVTEGWALRFFPSANATLVFTSGCEFTEE